MKPGSFSAGFRDNRAAHHTLQPLTLAVFGRSERAQGQGSPNILVGSSPKREQRPSLGDKACTSKQPSKASRVDQRPFPEPRVAQRGTNSWRASP